MSNQNKGNNQGGSFSVLAGVIVKMPRVNWPRARRVKCIFNGVAGSRARRSRPITLPSRPFDHKEGDT